MNRLLRILAGLGILASGGVAALLLTANRPEAEQSVGIRPLPVVETMPVSYGPVALTLPSQGMVEARKRATLSAEVPGKVVEVSPKLVAGEIFAEGEILLRLDPSDYEAALARAASEVASGLLALETEKARAEQAARDWQKLGRGGDPGDLTLRKFHVASAEAAWEAALEAEKQARRDLGRCGIRAPFSGRLSSAMVELGAYLAPGTPVAEIFTLAPWEIRLPLPLDDWPHLKRSAEGRVEGDVTLIASAGLESFEWAGRLVREEGEVARESRSVHVVAEIPAGESDSLMQPGLFVQAAVEGRELERAARVPFRAFLDLERVAVVDEENRLWSREVTVIRRLGDEVLVAAGLEEGERVCLTQLSGFTEGLEVEPRPGAIPGAIPGAAEPALGASAVHP